MDLNLRTIFYGTDYIETTLAEYGARTAPFNVNYRGADAGRKLRGAVDGHAGQSEGDVGRRAGTARRRKRC